ncbi:MAG: monovalent cation/H(+) antiporter subunit G [Clostridia bacterium]|nr:monovalent cation/H(+) antiporter subunit G [Clostridia bacterium]
MKVFFFTILLFSGLFFFLVGTIGILRLPDVLTRAHSAAKCDTLGAILSLSSLIILRGFDIVTIKILTIILFIWITSPTATHLISEAYVKKKEIRE